MCFFDASVMNSKALEWLSISKKHLLCIQSGSEGERSLLKQRSIPLGYSATEVCDPEHTNRVKFFKVKTLLIF